VKNKAGLLRPAARFQRIAILGIGNELNGDDAAGVLVARELLKKNREREIKPGSQSAKLYIVEAGLSPEAFTGPLRRFQPELVVLVDAAELGEPPGSVAWFDWFQADGMSASTHTLPPTVLAQFLMREIGCAVILIGIQPKCLALESGISKEVKRAVHQVIKELKTLYLG
jgi:hydrogenase 3 maturation protease